MEKIGEQFSSKPIVTENALCKEIIFVQADIHDCDESARKFGIEALPSVFILEQDQNGDKDYEILSKHFGQQVMRIQDEIESWLYQDQEIDNNTYEQNL